MPLASSILSVAPQFNDYSNDQAKIKAILTNPAALKVFALQCDIGSQAEIYIYDKDGIELEDDPLDEFFDNPNPFQTKSQWLWDFYFWTGIGTAYLYMDSNDPANTENKLYFLNPAKIEWPQSINIAKDKLIFSKQSEKVLMDTNILYRYEDGTSITIPLSKIITLTDLSNGTGNWFKGSSRIDALYKVISNSEKALDATNVNLEYSQRFLVGGTADPKDVTKQPLGNEEKQSIEDIMRGHKRIHAVKSMIDIKRFVEDMRSLELGKAYTEAYFIIGSMFGIPKDVLEAYLTNGATFENQEKAVGRHIAYTLQPKADDLFDAIARRMGLKETDRTIEASWDHLPFMQVFEKDRAATKQTNINTFNMLVKLKVPLDEINQYLDTNFSTVNYEQGQKANAGAGGGN